MRTKIERRRNQARGLPRDVLADAVSEFVFNDEEEALCSEDVALIHQRDMPALQEFLENMHELDTRSGGGRCH